MQSAETIQKRKRTSSPKSLSLKPNCEDILFWDFKNNICWFNALLISVFFGVLSRKLLQQKIILWSETGSKWNHRDELTVSTIPEHQLYSIFYKTLSNYFIRSATDISFFKTYNSMKILDILNAFNKDTFPILSTHPIGSAHLYIRSLYDFLKVTTLLIHRKSYSHYVQSAKKISSVVGYDDFNSVSQISSDSKHSLTVSISHLKREDVKKHILSNPEVLILRCEQTLTLHQRTQFSYTRTGMKYYHTIGAENSRNLNSMNESIIYNNQPYVLDSVIITNIDNGISHLNHEITCLTCNGTKYIYDGYVYLKDDEKYDDKLSCHFIPYDWDLKSDKRFYIKDCRVYEYLITDKISITELLQTRMYSFTQSHKLLIYVQDETTRPIKQ
jgi:hypothetical protein